MNRSPVLDAYRFARRWVRGAGVYGAGCRDYGRYDASALYVDDRNARGERDPSALGDVRDHVRPGDQYGQRTRRLASSLGHGQLENLEIIRLGVAPIEIDDSGIRPRDRS